MCLPNLRGSSGGFCRGMRHCYGVVRSALRRRLRLLRRFRSSGLAGPLRFDGLGRRSIVVRRRSGLFLYQFLAPHVVIFGVGLGQVAVAKALAGSKFRGAIRIFFQHYFQSPLGIGRRPRTAPAKVLFVLYFERADIALNTAQIFVDARHGGCRTPKNAWGYPQISVIGCFGEVNAAEFHDVAKGNDRKASSPANCHPRWRCVSIAEQWLPRPIPPPKPLRMPLRRRYVRFLRLTNC